MNAPWLIDMTNYRFASAAEFDFSRAETFRKRAPLPREKVEVSRSTQEVVTHVGAREETRNTARPGDVIVTGINGERYVIAAARFPDLYEPDPHNPKVFRSKSVVRAIKLAEPLEIMAPWGERQRVDAGGRICQVVGKPSDVYLIEQDSFERTYAREASVE